MNKWSDLSGVVYGARIQINPQNLHIVKVQNHSIHHKYIQGKGRVAVDSGQVESSPVIICTSRSTWGGNWSDYGFTPYLRGKEKKC